MVSEISVTIDIFEKCLLLIFSRSKHDTRCDTSVAFYSLHQIHELDFIPVCRNVHQIRSISVTVDITAINIGYASVMRPLIEKGYRSSEIPRIINSIAQARHDTVRNRV